MAIIVPFGDPNAHGSLANSVTFRRTRSGVVFQKKPNPVVRYTPAQLAQRSAFSSAQSAFYSYDVVSKEYINPRAVALGMTPRQLFSSAQMRGLLPAQLDLCDITNFVSLQAFDNSGRTNSDFVISFLMSQGMGYWESPADFDIELNALKNIQTLVVPHIYLEISIYSSIAIPERFGFSLVYTDGLNVEHTATFRLPACTPGMVTPLVLYATADLSLWTEFERLHWRTTNNF